MRVELILLGFAVAASAGSAAGQHPLVLQKLQELNTAAPKPSPQQIESAIAVTAAAVSTTNKTCAPKSLKISQVAPITGATGIMQAAIAGKIRNAWTAYADHVGCDGGQAYRYLIIQLPDASLKALPVSQGQTFTNPSIMRDTSTSAALAALQKAKSMNPTCEGKDMKMGLTKVVDQSKDLGPDLFGVRYTGKWSESWQFETCGHVFAVPVDFTPDGDGGAYTKVAADQVVMVR